ncbi:MAG: hypothetical protein IJJ82_05355 [Clostridia bacterium]|nr:hypothetical protein [Clostridia bacterium]
MTTQEKKRVNVEVVLVYLLITIFLIYLLSIFFSKLSMNICDYKVMREKEYNTEMNVALPIESSSSVDYPSPNYEQQTPEQIILEKAGLPADTEVNMALMQGIACLTEHEVGFDPDYFIGYDFDEIQQTMAASVINRMRSEDFPYGFPKVVNQEGQYPDMWEYICKNHSYVSRETLINVLKVYYHKSDYSIPKDIFFEHSFPYDESLEEATDIGEVTPAVGNSYQAAEWLAEQGVSTGLYSYSSYIYDEGNGVKRLLLFSGSSTGPY